MSEAYLTRCDNCGWHGPLGERQACPNCRARGGSLTDEAAERLHALDLTSIERINRRRGRAVRTRTLGRRYVRIIPKRKVSTSKAKDYHVAKGLKSEEKVARLKAMGLTNQQVANELNFSEEWVSVLWNRSKARTPAQE